MNEKTEAVRLHKCSASNPVSIGTTVPRLPWRTIDMHCHIFVPELEQLVADEPARKAERDRELESLGEASRAVNAQQFETLIPRFASVEKRLEDMDAMGVDIQVLSPSPTQYHYWADIELAERIVAAQNDHIADLCGRHPNRFLSFGTVALQHPARAAEQLTTLIREHGFKGVEISSVVGGRDIADRYFDPFWQRADELGAVIFIHPWGTSVGARLSEYYLMNTIGQPLETTICLSKLIFGGTLDRHSGLKIVAAHGGGYLPAYSGRSDHAHAVRPEAGGCGCAPSKLLQRIWYDSVVYDAEELQALVDRVGVEQIVTGTDYPFDMGEYNPSGLVADFSEEDQQRILGGNAAQLLGLQACS